MRIFLATRNAGKIREIKSILSGTGVELVDAGCVARYPEPPESGETFRENALVKARAARAATGLPSLADDSGLEVDALRGGPGVRSARYGGGDLSDEQRSLRLLEALRGVPPHERGARFRCVMVLCPAPGHGETLETEGMLYGRIAEHPAGSNGFGYDPVFFVPEFGMTLAEMEPRQKNSISHRYRALIEMKWLLVRGYGLKTV